MPDELTSAFDLVSAILKGLAETQRVIGGKSGRFRCDVLDTRAWQITSFGERTSGQIERQEIFFAQNFARMLAANLFGHFRSFPSGGLHRHTPGPPPFSSMNSTLVASDARRRLIISHRFAQDRPLPPLSIGKVSGSQN